MHNPTLASSAPIPISAPFIGEEEKKAVLAVLESGMLVQGPRVAELEARFARLCGTRHAVATSSGTTALYLALLANGVGPGDEVITSPFTFVASVNAILYTGARPIFADIDEATFNIGPEQIEAAFTPRTKAIMPVHLYGLMADMDPIVAIAERHGLAVVEDAAQAVGATYRDRSAGSFGTGCFSLYATKNAMAGEGGIVTTDDDTVADRVRLLRSHGMRQRYQYETLGYNFRLSDLHAAIGVAQMDRVAEFTEARERNAAYLSQTITSVRTPSSPSGRRHVWHQYTIRVSHMDRDEAVRRLTEAGVGTGIFYPAPVTAFPHVRAVTGGADVPVAERIAREVISLPVHPRLRDEDLQRIAMEVNRL